MLKSAIFVDLVGSGSQTQVKKSNKSRVALRGTIKMFSKRYTDFPKCQWVWTASNFNLQGFSIILRGGWPNKSITHASSHPQCTVNVLVLEHIQVITCAIRITSQTLKPIGYNDHKLVGWTQNKIGIKTRKQIVDKITKVVLSTQIKFVFILNSLQIHLCLMTTVFALQTCQENKHQNWRQL